MLVEKTFLINLRIRPDRRDAFFQRYPVNDMLPTPEVWPAIHGDTCIPPDNWHAGNGAWGCYKTHLNILEHCLNNNIGSYVVFEDDAHFTNDFATKLRRFADELPDDWHQIYLGGQLLHEWTHPPIKMSDNIFRPFNVNRTHCFGVSRDGLIPIYRHLCNLPFHPKEHIDHHLGRLHETYNLNVYTPSHWIVGQGGDSSNVSGKTEPVRFFGDPAQHALSHKLYKEPACIVLRGNQDAALAALPYTHRGYNCDSVGYDKGLSEAWKYAYPGPEISRWFSHVRSEIVRTGENKLPCLWHPRITDEMISLAGIGQIICIESSSPEHATQQIKQAVETYYSN